MPEVNQNIEFFVEFENLSRNVIRSSNLNSKILCRKLIMTLNF
jgi:hypothetical protein